MLSVLRLFEGLPWNKQTQEEFQVQLIQRRYYGFGSSQFYSNLKSSVIKVIEDESIEISSELAREIFDAKNYVDPPHRGRESFNPLKKFGFAIVQQDKTIAISELGKLFLKEDCDLQDIFLRIFLKWQIPNPDNRNKFKSTAYNIKPFVGTLRLISCVNQLEEARGNKPKGISREEFSLFVPTLIHWRDIETRASSIVKLRDELAKHQGDRRHLYFKTFRSQYAAEFLGSSSPEKIQRLIDNLADYGDNAIRYFRLTSYVHLRGQGYYIDLEPRRAVEIDALLDQDRGAAIQFQSKQKFIQHITDPLEPKFPWDVIEAHYEIIQRILGDINSFEQTLNQPLTSALDYEVMNELERKAYISQLRSRRLELQNAIQKIQSQSAEEILNCIDVLQNIYKKENRALLLEKMVTVGLQALDDAIRVQPNYPIGDDNEPTFTAPANTPDIECYYESFNAICEVTMLTDRSQWYHEGQPVMRHLRDFENENSAKPVYCVFIAPKVHRDTLNTFWNAIKFGYEEHSQSIIPLTIDQFTIVLRTLHSLRTRDTKLLHTQLQHLYDQILQSSQFTENSAHWLASIPNTIESWTQRVLL